MSNPLLLHYLRLTKRYIIAFAKCAGQIRALTLHTHRNSYVLFIKKKNKQNKIKNKKNKKKKQFNLYHSGQSDDRFLIFPWKHALTFLIFPQKHSLTFHANYLLMRWHLFFIFSLSSLLFIKEIVSLQSLLYISSIHFLLSDLLCYWKKRHDLYKSKQGDIDIMCPQYILNIEKWE